MRTFEKIILGCFLSLGMTASYAGSMCSISSQATNMDFGTYVKNDSGDLDATSTFSFGCSFDGGSSIGDTVTYTVTLDIGSTRSGETFASGLNRKMLRDGSAAAPNTLLEYSLYPSVADRAANTSVWGDGVTGGTFALTGTITKLTPLTLPQVAVPVPTIVYGRVFGAQTIDTGSYLDQMLVTIDF